jgi:hypothetical protein
VSLGGKWSGEWQISKNFGAYGTSALWQILLLPTPRQKKRKIILPHPVGTPGGKPQRLTASAKKVRERPYFPQPRLLEEPLRNELSSFLVKAGQPCQ